MATAFGIFSGALTVADVCIKAGKYLRSIQKTSKKVAEEIKYLESEINKFNGTYTSLAELCATEEARKYQESQAPSGLSDPYIVLWTRASDLAKEGQSLVEKLRDLFEGIVGRDSKFSNQKLEDVRIARHIVSKDDEYHKLRVRFNDLNTELSTMLIGIDLVSNSIFRSELTSSLEHLPAKLSQKVQELGLQLKRQIQTLDQKSTDVNPSIQSAKAALAFASLNQHFYVQKPDTSIWTGRKKHLEHISDAMLKQNADGQRVQKRFVLLGISGTGKTQLCCKFAQDYRESFWGIFWIDASSEQSIMESWKRIAKIGGKDANEDAGKYWLSNLGSPWLLIIDNADGFEKSIQLQFPSGERGCILITTRNPRMRINATVGFVILDRLEENEADELLRKATNHEPWDVSARSYASSIAKHLEYLPLALIHAGSAILNHLTTLQGYIQWFEKALDDFRKKKRAGSSIDVEDDGMGAFTSFDILYSGLEAQTYRSGTTTIYKDAIELINIFAFLHHNDIKLDMFVKAERNLQYTPAQRIEEEDVYVSTSLERVKGFATDTFMKFTRPLPVLPQIFYNGKSLSFDESRARKAMNVLVQVSLLSESWNAKSGSYSMHPLVHAFVRKRLGLSAQALWNGVAGDVLAGSIKIPPMIDEPDDQDFYRHLLPHIEQVRLTKDDITNQLWQHRRRASWLRFWIRPESFPPFATINALSLAKYSRVYLENSKLNEAAELQQKVRDYVVKRLGRENVFVIHISLALAKTLWLLTRPEEAQELQEDALRICRLKYGEAHAQTLKAMDALGETYWQRGLLKEAKALHESVILGMEGKPHLKRDRFRAMTHLGHVYEWYIQHDEAYKFHKQASEGLEEAYGANDVDALIAKTSFAMTLLAMGNVTQVRQAHTLMQDVYDRRFETLGREHIYTLWAACYLARTLISLGALEDDMKMVKQAKQILDDGLTIAKVNLGSNHIGVLMARSHVADALVVEKHYEDAENEYKDVATLQKSIAGARNGTHRDRLSTLQRLGKCYEAQGKLEEACQTYSTFVQEVDSFGGQKHPWRLLIMERKGLLAQQLRNDGAVSQTMTNPSVSGSPD